MIDHWQAEAACIGKQDLFFAPAAGGTGHKLDFDYGPAVQLCREQCPVLAECRAWAIEAGEIDRKGRVVHGVVAGLAPVATGQLASTATCGTEAGYKRHLRETGSACASCRAANAAAKRRAS